MRKSILVIDTPENCNECILSGEYIDCTGEIISGENICHGCREYNYDSAKKPDWCPLQNVVKAEPTAYDVDKVVERLQVNSMHIKDEIGAFVSLDDAIEIVKSGGVE